MKEKINKILNTVNNIKYGFVTSDGVVHKNAKRQYFLDNYRLMNIEDIIKYQVGTCYEQTELIGYLLDKENIPYKKYNVIYDVEGKIARHTFAVVQNDNKYILMESSWLIDNNEFDSLEDLIISVVKKYPRMYKLEDFNIDIVEVYEYNKVIFGCTFDEYTANIRKTGIKIDVDLNKIYN
jgi:hypothetical protein